MEMSETGQVVYARTYSRTLPDGTRESWPDTVRRVVDGNLAFVDERHRLPGERDDLIAMMTAFQIIPAGRHLWSTGIKSQHLFNCLGRDTLVHTDQGVLPIHKLAGDTHNVLSEGGKYRPARFDSYGEQELLKVTLMTGEEILATPDHSWVTYKPGRGPKMFFRTTTAKLSGKRIPYNPAPAPDRDADYWEGVAHGIIYGDGQRSGNISTMISLFGEKRELSGYLADYSRNDEPAIEHDARAYVGRLPKDWKDLPSAPSRSYARGFIVGLIATDGYARRGTVQINQSKCATEIAEIATWAGFVVRSVLVDRETSPFTGEYAPSYRIRLLGFSVDPERDLIRSSHREKFEASRPAAVRSVGVRSVEPTGRFEEVFCAVESETHTITVGSGVLTGQCWSAHHTKSPADHFRFTFARLMEGGGVGANYSNRHLTGQPPVAQRLSVQIVCDPAHADYTTLRDAGVLSERYDYQWPGAFAVEDSREGWADALTDLVDTFYRDDVEHEHRVYDVSRVRPAGAPLRTFGGTASGPLPLAKMLIEAAGVFNRRTGQRLDGMSVMEIDHAIASAVVAGGVRRSARLGAMHWDDDQVFEFIDCKSSGGGHWSSNISVEVDTDFWEQAATPGSHAAKVLELLGEGAVRNGEPGMWDRSLNNVNEPHEIYVSNPCLTANATLFTERGVESFGDLFKAGTDNTILTDARVSYHDDGGPEAARKWQIDMSKSGAQYRAASEVFLTQRDATTIWLNTREGFRVNLTPDHLVATPHGMVEAGSLQPGDQVLITKGEPTGSIVGQSPVTDRQAEMLLMGLIAGDGTYSKGKLTEQVHIDLYGDKAQRAPEVVTLLDRLFDNYHYKAGGNRPYTAYQMSRTDRKVRISSSFLARHLKERYAFSRDTKEEVPAEVLAEARGDGRWYAAGMMFCDGTVNVGKSRDSVRLNQSNQGLLRDVQMIMLANGIYSRIYLRRKAGMRMMPDGRGGLKEYAVKPNYEIVCYSDRGVYGRVIGFWNSPKDDKLATITTGSYHPSSLATVESISTGETQDVYCLREPVSRSLVANGIAMRRCGEIGLNPWEPCCLGHVNLAAFFTDHGDVDYPSLIRAHHLMTRFLIRATFAPVDDPRSREVLDRNRRIGVGHLGVASFLAIAGHRFADAPHNPWFIALLDSLSAHVDKTAVAFCHDLRIPVPVKKRTVAPTGSTAKMPGVSEGIHPIFSRYFERRIRFSNVDPAQMETVEDYRCRGYRIEDDLYAANTTVVCIPTKDSLLDAVAAFHGPDEAERLVQSADELTLDELLAFQALYQQHWADNAVSFTANIDPERYTGAEVAETLLRYAGRLKGSTIFPEASMPQAPYTRITREQYEAAITQDVGDGVDLECASGGCPLR